MSKYFLLLSKFNVKKSQKKLNKLKFIFLQYDNKHVIAYSLNTFDIISYKWSFNVDNINTNAITNSLFYISKYISLVSFFYTKIQTTWMFTNLIEVSVNNNFYVYYSKFIKNKYTKFLTLSKISLYNIFIQLSLLRSPQLLINVLQRKIFKIPVKRHRSFFRKIREIVCFWYFLIFSKKRIKGYSLFFKGKLGRKGSVRKKKIFVKEGITSFTNKEVRVNYKNFILWTDTGVVGANISIFF